MSDHSASAAQETLMGQICEDYLDRLGRGERPNIEEYAGRYPELAPAIRQMLPALEVIRRPALDDDLSGLSADEAPPSGCLGDFRIIGEIGRGGMGIVYEAEQISLNRRVALKVLPFAATLDAKHLQRFKNEAQAAGQLHHTNIVPVYFVGCERGVHFYAMQFIEGQSLAGVLADLQGGVEKMPLPSTQSFPLVGHDSVRDLQIETLPQARLSTQLSQRGAGFFRTVARWGIEAAHALEHAHDLGVIHRDIKPANLLVDYRGNLWVTDFGLAQIQGANQLTLTGDLLGTLRYMSPEQALAKRVPVDPRTDIYSLGATLYELLTLEPAFMGSDRQELLRQIAFEEPIAPRRHNKSIPPELETIVLKAMEKNPAYRYATAHELADDLERFVKDEPIRAKRPSLGRRLRQLCRRHKPLATGLGVLVLTVLFLGGAYLWQRESQRAATAQAASDDLREAEIWQKQEQWAKALPALERAAGRLAGSGLESLQIQVAERRREVALIARLEKARLQAVALSWRQNRDYAAVDRAYYSAFAENGLDVSSSNPGDTARRLAASPIRSHLVRALDNWAFCKDHLPGDEGKRLRAITQLADDDPWRQRLRDLQLTSDQPALKRLATEESVLTQGPENLLILFSFLDEAKEFDAGVGLLRKAQQLYPADFWLNYQLCFSLGSKPATAQEAISFGRAALAIQPQTPVVYLNLANALGQLGLDREPEAEALCRKAIDLQPDYAVAYIHLANNQTKQKKYAASEAAYRKAIELQPDDPRLYLNLGYALSYQEKWPQAEAACRQALTLKADVAEAHGMIGDFLAKQKKLTEAVAAYRKAVELKPDFDAAYHNLGNALVSQCKLTEAVAAYRRAIELDPDFAGTYGILGNVLVCMDKLPEALTSFHKAIELDPKNAVWHNAAGLALTGQHQLPEAEAAFRKAIDLKPDFAEAYHNLGIALLGQQNLAQAAAAQQKARDLKIDDAQIEDSLGSSLLLEGRFVESLACFKRVHELHSPSPEWSGFDTDLRLGEKLVELDAKLTRILKGEISPADNAERLELAALCQRRCRQLYLASARFYREAFTAEPDLAGDIRTGARFAAACASALAGCGHGKDAADLELNERARLRGQALAWLQADLAGWRSELPKDPDKARRAVQQEMQRWLQNENLDDLRTVKGLDRLPEHERRGWQEFWQTVEILRRGAVN